MFVHDSDIQKIIGPLAAGKPVSVTIHPPFDYEQERMRGQRHFDKEYSLDGLTVFVEAELGKKDLINRDDTLVTMKEQEAYLHALARAEEKLMKRRVWRLSALRAYERVWNYTEAPLVDDPNDRDLTAIRVKSVHVQYEGADIAPLKRFFLDRESDTACLAKCYGIEIGPPSYGFVEELQIPTRAPQKPELVFFQRISGDDLLLFEKGIRAVYTAGAGIRDILESDWESREQQILTSSQKT